MRQSALVNGKKTEQVVVRLSAELLQAVRDHRLAMEKARPFERVTMATAVRDLLARSVVKKRR